MLINFVKPWKTTWGTVCAENIMWTVGSTSLFFYLVITRWGQLSNCTPRISTFLANYEMRKIKANRKMVYCIDVGVTLISLQSVLSLNYGKLRTVKRKKDALFTTFRRIIAENVSNFWCRPCSSKTFGGECYAYVRFSIAVFIISIKLWARFQNTRSSVSIWTDCVVINSRS